MSINYCVDVPFDAVDFDFRLLLGDVVSCGFCEEEEDGLVDVTDEELEERVWFQSFLAAVIMELIPELTVRLAQIGHAKSRLAGSTSRLKTILNGRGKGLRKPDNEIIRDVSAMSKEIIDVFNEVFNLFSNKCVSFELKCTVGP
jgi:hypothetical protein